MIWNSGIAVVTSAGNSGPTSPGGWVKPDLVTSGRSVVSLAAPGAEGVETEAQLAGLRALGCPIAQGFCFPAASR